MSCTGSGELQLFTIAARNSSCNTFCFSQSTELINRLKIEEHSRRSKEDAVLKRAKSSVVGKWCKLSMHNLSRNRHFESFTKHHLKKSFFHRKKKWLIKQASPINLWRELWPLDTYPIRSNRSWVFFVCRSTFPDCDIKKNEDKVRFGDNRWTGKYVNCLISIYFSIGFSRALKSSMECQSWVKKKIC